MSASDKWRDGVPNMAGAFAGGAAAGALGWKAGAVAGEKLTGLLPDDISPMIEGGLENSLAALGLFGFMYVGYRVGLRKPGESVLIAGATLAALGTQKVHPMSVFSWGNTPGAVFAHPDASDHVGDDHLATDDADFGVGDAFA